MDGKRVGDSEIVLSQLMQPENANNLGNIHGGVLMKLIDEAGAMCATRHARAPAVTVAVDSLTFLEPVHIGDLVTFSARLTYVGHTSMETEVVVEAEEILTGRRRITNRAYVVYVALSGEGRPLEVPPLVPGTDEERARWESGKKRQQARLARR
ncbi:MAG: acyl-CoA thioesterase [Deltaproteobacteria bacterium]|nr:acyl-CoA thioesterase [Deltaproteobacteria bacterium]MCL5278232.1 acyl-CoA thioesterase [Deltaproteobacteria bacterium]